MINPDQPASTTRSKMVAPQYFKLMAFRHAVLGALLLVVGIYSNTASAACSSPAGNQGALIYNSASYQFQYCNDTNWIAVNLPGNGTGGCSNPVRAEGQMIYNKDARVLQGCAGDDWRPMGRVGGKNRYLDLAHSGPDSNSSTCAIAQDKEMYCWGGNSDGQLGIGTNSWKELTPVKATESGPWSAVVGGYGFMCGLKEAGSIWCAGPGGLIGTGDGVNRNLLTQIAVAGPWTKLSSGFQHSCAIRQDGTAWCWGVGTKGELGNGAVLSSNTPVQVGTVGTSTLFSDWVQISAGYLTSCGVRSNGTAWCWGVQDAGALGHGVSTYGLAQSTPVQVGTAGSGTIFTDWTNIVTGTAVTCGIRSGGAAWCWGANNYGQLGIGNTTSVSVPNLVTGSGGWSLILPIGDNSLGLKTDGTGWGMGKPSSGYTDLENITLQSTTANDLNPDQMATPLRWQKFSAGLSGLSGGSACGLTDQGGVFCWGDAGYGALATDTEIYEECTGIPLQQSTATDTWIDVAAVGDDSYDTSGCALRDDRSIWCWGGNFNGFLGAGLGPVTSVDLVTIAQAGPWRSLEGSEDNHICATKEDNTAWCWGRDNVGQLGNGAGTTGDQFTPSQVVGGAVWQGVYPGFNSTCGIRTDGSAWCWGEESASGNLGNGSGVTGNQVSPTSVTGGGTWIQISAGSTHSCGVKSDNTGWCWGSDASGQLGNGGGVTADQHDPYLVAGGYSWQKIERGTSISCGLRTDGVMMCWGSDATGKLGNGPAETANKDVPFEVAGNRKWTDFAIGAGGGAICGISEGSVYCWGEGWMWGTLGDCDYVDYDEPHETLIDFAAATKIDMAETQTMVIEKGKITTFGSAYDYAYGPGIRGKTYIMEPSGILCASPVGRPGDIIYNDDQNVMQYCDGGGWVRLGI